MARQIGKMLNTREPKIVHGPEILNKYVGQSEENIRALFKEAEVWFCFGGGGGGGGGGVGEREMCRRALFSCLFFPYLLFSLSFL